ncbi:MAG: tyrosinase family protein [Pseudomonadota bacterium]
MFTRENVYDLGDNWADPILWYARGVQSMKARPLADVRSWRFYGGIHGHLRGLWDLHGITDPVEPGPSDEDVATYFDQCQHQSWFFLPWHRGYLLALERQIRHEIEALGGPHESWALPYWNYLEDGRSGVPPAFRTRSWPDGTDDNPLFVEQRWGLIASGPSPVFQQLVHLNPMSDREFSGPGNGGSTGFGGRPTGFNWSGGDNGGAEWQPHNIVHTLVGGQHPSAFLPLPPPNHEIPIPGLMSATSTSALDPIFYLHHCNIDRLWESWNRFPAGKPAINPNDWQNPSGSDWRDGPAASGDRSFTMPNPDSTAWVFTPDEMQSIEGLDYGYANLTPGAQVEPDNLTRRVARLGLAPPRTMSGGVAMSPQKTVEMIGTGEGKIALSGTAQHQASVRLDQPTVDRLSENLSGAAPQPGLPDRVFLNLENVRSQSDAVIFKVYVGMPPGTDPADSDTYFAGTVSLFGATLASDPAGKHAGNGITHVLEVTDIFDRLYLDNTLESLEISVDLVPVDDIPAAAQVEIGNISFYRQSE